MDRKDKLIAQLQELVAKQAEQIKQLTVAHLNNQTTPRLLTNQCGLD